MTQTIMIGNKKLPCDRLNECPDFRFNHDGEELVFKCDDRDDSWCKVSLLGNAPRRHAASVAAEWYEHLAEIDMTAKRKELEAKHGVDLNPVFLKEIVGAADKYRARARAWREIIDWSAGA